MRTWSLNPESPFSLRIAADARLTTPDYFDDQIWELTFGGGEPANMAIQTNYGLRATGMRIFPGFSLGGAVVSDPAQFYSTPVIENIFPNYLVISCYPFQGLRVKCEYWVINSKILAGKFSLHNESGASKALQVRLFSLLVPGKDGERMQAWEHMGATCLVGRVGGLVPAVFMRGGVEVEHTVYPALVQNLRIRAKGENSIVWAHAGLDERIDSFETARSAVSRPWEAEIARLELTNSSLIDIETGDEDLDAVFRFSQKVALGSLVGPTSALPKASFVGSRIPERGFSRLRDGIDHHQQWEGQSVVNTYLLLQQFLESSPHIAKDLIRNFCFVQKPDGSIDWQPGLGGQRKDALAQPLLASMTWKIFERTLDHQFLEEVFDVLLEFYWVWFEKDHDRDQDGFPEWDHTVQMGFDDCPNFVLWHAWGQGLDISKTETPDLASYLYKEACSLIRIAQELQREDPLPLLNAKAEQLRQRVEGAWSEKRTIYQYQDRDTHAATHFESLGSGQGEFVIQVDRAFDELVRLVFRAVGQSGNKRSAKAFIHGQGSTKRHRVEQIRGKDIQWFSNTGSATSNTTYMEIERVEVRGLDDECRTEVSIADYSREDVSLLLPLWAEIPEAERVQELVKNSILNPERFWRPFGITSSPADDPAYQQACQEGYAGISLFWNILVGEGLLAYGYRKQAAGLVQNLLQAIKQVLKEEKAFKALYHPDYPTAFGERDHISGLAPTGLFLECLGVKIIQPSTFILRGDNPFTWPVTLRWRGFEIHCYEDHKQVVFPSGEQVTVQGEEPTVVRLDRN